MTKLVAIINITPDSFSDGGECLAIDAAMQRINDAIAHGADVIDIGAESTRPGAQKLNDTQEWKRLEPILHLLMQEKPTVNISLDSYHPQTIERALELGAIDIINDVDGLRNHRMVSLAIASHLPVVMMHSLSIPARKDETIANNIPAITTLNHWLDERLNTLAAKRLDSSKLIVDPGIGFGKSAQQSWQLINNISELNTHGLPLYIGHSRKSFLQTHANEPANQRDPETLKASCLLMQQNIDYLRVHNIKSHNILRQEICHE